jgi:hypothetical protein
MPLGRSLDLIVPERPRERHWRGYGRVMQTGQTRYGENDVLSVPALRKDGATISVEFTIYLMNHDGRMIGLRRSCAKSLSASTRCGP